MKIEARDRRVKVDEIREGEVFTTVERDCFYIRTNRTRKEESGEITAVCVNLSTGVIVELSVKHTVVKIDARMVVNNV